MDSPEHSEYYPGTLNDLKLQIMKMKDFEDARREGMMFDRFHLLNDDVLSVEGHVEGHNVERLHGVWGSQGRFWAYLQQPGMASDGLVRELVPSSGIHACYNGVTLVRTPWFDLKFE